MTFRQCPISLTGHTRPVVQVDFSEITPWGYFLISACKDGNPMLRQGDTGDWIGTFKGHTGAVWASTLNKDATRAATGAADFTAKVWDAVKGSELMSLQHKHIVKSVHFSKDSNKLLTGSNEKKLRIFDLEKHEEPLLEMTGHTGSIKSALYMEDNKTIISLSEDKTLRVWDPLLAEPCIRTVDLPSSPSHMEMSRGGAVLNISMGNSVSFYKSSSLEVERSYKLPCPVYSASLHPTERVFVAGGEDFKLYKCDYETGEELESYKGHFGPVHCVRFSPDGCVYASGSEDGTLRLWQNQVGHTYGLWKFSSGDAAEEPGTNAA